MIEINDRVRFKEELIKDRRLPPYDLIVRGRDTDGVSWYFDLEEVLTGALYLGVHQNTLRLVKKHEPKKFPKNKKGEKKKFRLNENMFLGIWAITIPSVLIAYIFTGEWLVFLGILFPILVGGLGDEEPDKDDF